MAKDTDINDDEQNTETALFSHSFINDTKSEREFAIVKTCSIAQISAVINTGNYVHSVLKSITFGDRKKGITWVKLMSNIVVGCILGDKKSASFGQLCFIFYFSF